MRKEFMKQVAAYEMPDIEKVKLICEQELEKSEKHKKSVYRKWMVAVAVCFLLVVCIFVTPLGSYAVEKLQQLFRTIHVNGTETNLGSVETWEITIPQNAHKEGEKSYVKIYNSLKEMELETGLDIKAWGGDASFWQDGITLGIEEDDYALINLIYDNSDGKNIPIFMNIFIPLSKETTLLESEADVFFSYEDGRVFYQVPDEQGDYQEESQQESYEIVEEYKSEALGTKVTAIAYHINAEHEDQIYENTFYYMDFVYDGKVYEVCCRGTLEEAKEVVENMEK